MRKTDRQSKLRVNLHRLMAVAFLFVLLAEWGSHSLAFAHSLSNETPVLHAEHEAHEDLCKTLIRCPDGPLGELPASRVGHDMGQQNPFFANFKAETAEAWHYKGAQYHRSRISGLFRALNPPFQPPKQLS